MKFKFLFTLLLLSLPNYTLTKPVFDTSNQQLHNIEQVQICKNIYSLNCSNLKYSNTTCVLCKTLVSTIDYSIKKGNNTIQEITEIIKDICCMVHGPSGNECVFVLNNIQEIVKMITNGLTNLQICKDLHLC